MAKVSARDGVVKVRVRDGVVKVRVRDVHIIPCPFFAGCATMHYCAMKNSNQPLTSKVCLERQQRTLHYPVRNYTIQSIKKLI